MLSKFSFKSEFSRNVFTLATGTTISQIIPVVASPILTRIYMPEDFGMFAVFSSAVAILMIFATGKYDIAIMLPKLDKHSNELALLSAMIAIVVTTIAFAILLMMSHILENEQFRQLGHYWYLVPFAVFLGAIYQIVTTLFARQHQYKLISINKIYQSIVNVLLQILFGLLSLGLLGLIIGYIIGVLTGLFLFLKKIMLKNYCLSKYRIKRIQLLSVQYIRFPKYELTQSLIDSFHNYGVVFLFAYFYTSQEVGYFALASKISMLPISMVSSSIAQVFYSHVSKNIQSIQKTSLSILKKLIYFSIVPYVIVYIFSEDFLAVVFGNKWTEAGSIVSILSFWLLVKFVSSPLSTIPFLLNRQKEFLQLGIVYNCLIFGLTIVCGCLKVSFLQTIAIVYFSAGIYLVYVIYWLIKQTRRSNEI